MLLHDRKVQGIARRESPVTKDDLLGTLEDGVVDGQYLIDYAKQGIKCRLNGIAAVNRNVAMQDLLQYLGIGNQALALAEEFLDPALRVYLMRVRSAYQVHRNIGIDQDHDCRSVR